MANVASISEVPRAGASPLSGAAGIGLLALGAGLVGVAIVIEGTVGRAINGVGVVAWIAGTLTLIWQLRRAEGFAWRLSVAAVVAIGIATVVRPNDLVGALIGFSLAGVGLALIARERPLAWAALVPAIYLPAHVAIAIGRSVINGSSQVRVDPPPTAALVPLCMVAAALLGGGLVQALRRR